MSNRRPVVIRHGEARISSEDAPDALLYVTSEITAGTLTVIEAGGTEVGCGPPMHIDHKDRSSPPKPNATDPAELRDCASGSPAKSRHSSQGRDATQRWRSMVTVQQHHSG